VHRQFEQLEVQRVRDLERHQLAGAGGEQQYGLQQQYNEQLRQLQLQKDHMENNMFNMRNDIKQYMESFKEGMMNRGGGGGYGGYADQFNQMQGQRFDQHSSS
jgi:hypothetical protein